MAGSTPVVWASSPPYHPPPRTQLKELASELGGTLSQGLAALYPRAAGGSSSPCDSSPRTAASPSPASTPAHPIEASLPIDVYDAGRERVLSASFHRVAWEEGGDEAAGPSGRVTGERRVLCVGYTHGFHVRPPPSLVASRATLPRADRQGYTAHALYPALPMCPHQSVLAVSRSAALSCDSALTLKP
jgi:hypothetical protein